MVSSSFFHFTRRYNVLLKILKCKYFIAGYNYEILASHGKKKEYQYLPMLCFCDIPLRSIQDLHTKRYGKFGIGIKKRWGQINKLKPVEYRMNVNETRDLVINEIEIAITNQLKSIPPNLTLVKTLDNAKYAFAFEVQNSKPYSFILVGKEIINYMDREWRAIPEKPIMGRSFKRDMELLKTFTSKHRYTYSFMIDDIEHIILKENKTITKFIKDIEKLSKVGLYTKQEVLLIASKIITLEKLKMDI